MNDIRSLSVFRCINATDISNMLNSLMDDEVCASEYLWMERDGMMPAKETERYREGYGSREAKMCLLICVQKLYRYLWIFMCRLDLHSFRLIVCFFLAPLLYIHTFVSITNLVVVSLPLQLIRPSSFDLKYSVAHRHVWSVDVTPI